MNTGSICGRITECFKGMVPVLRKPTARMRWILEHFAESEISVSSTATLLSRAVTYEVLW
jgi:hypothetical protein